MESADRVLRVLEVFKGSQSPLSLSDIADGMKLPKSSVHRLLGTLLDHGFVERDDSSKRYRLGIKLFEIGSRVIHDRGLYAAAGPVVEDLSAAAGETCHLAVLSGVEAVYVYKVDGPSTIVMSSRVGGRAPVYCTSIGKVLIAWAGDDVFDRVVDAGLRPYTANTIRSARRLAAELDKVRNDRYALDVEEYQAALCCVAAPVRDHTGGVIAALGLAGPASRMTNHRLKELSRDVMASAKVVSRNLGFIEPSVNGSRRAASSARR